MAKPYIISQFMSPAVYTVSPSHTLEAAAKVMKKYRIRHLPVVSKRKAIGILTEHTLKAAIASGWANSLTVEEVMAPAPYTVRPSAKMEAVLTQMMKDRFGSVVVQEASGKVVGIFTTVDALYTLRALFRGVN